MPIYKWSGFWHGWTGGQVGPGQYIRPKNLGTDKIMLSRLPSSAFRRQFLPNCEHLCSFLLPAAASSKRRQHLSEARNCRCPQRISPQGNNFQVFTFCCYFLWQEIPAISSFMACTAKSLQLFLVAGKKLLQRRHMPWRAKTCYAALQLAKGFLQLGLLGFSCLQPSRLCKKTLQMHSEAGQARTCYAASLSG